jgi:class 3 adenylate cyclase
MVRRTSLTSAEQAYPTGPRHRRRGVARPPATALHAHAPCAVRLCGTEVGTADDGLLATFDGPARAIRCARSIQREAAQLGLALRAGVHTGEVERVDRTVRGFAVHIAARIAALVSSGEILISSTVKDLVAGFGLMFEDRGLHPLKGVPEPRQLLVVSGGM